MSEPRKLTIQKVARDGVVPLRPYIPGKPLEEVREEYGLEEVVKLASNECPFPPPHELIAAIAAEAANLRRYPDGSCRKLASRLAPRLDVPRECLVFGNGAEECVRLVAQTFLNQGENAVLPKPIFDAYETATILAGAHCKEAPLIDYRIDLEAMLAAVDARTKLVWLCSPANPTGTVLERQAFERFLEALPDNILVVLDEAYREFVTSSDAPRAEDYLFKDDRVIGLRTFSKAHGIAGLRIGYITAHPDLAALIAKVKLPFNVNVMAQAAALYHLEQPKFAERHVAIIISERTRMTTELQQRGMFVVPSETNFLLVELPLPVDSVFPKLLEKGFIIRPGSIWGLPRFMRLSLGLPQQNNCFLAELDTILHDNKTVSELEPAPGGNGASL